MPAPRQWFEKDFYKVLGVSDTATEKEITRAYRKLAKEHHPDAGSGSEDRFKEVSAAYDVLGDAAKRKEYDEVRRLGPMGGMGPMGGPGGPGSGFSSFRVEDIGDLFGGLFNRGRRGQPTGPQRGQDVEAGLHLSFDDAVNGITATVNVTSDAACSACHGTGAAAGTSPVICPTCGGRGVTDDNQGFFSFSQPCRNCAGTGMKVETPCRNCGGSGVEHRPRQVKVRVPAGVADGQRIRVKGRGGAGANGGPSGDLYVVVSVAPHELFGRSSNGKDLTLTVPVTFAEAALGATVKVPTLDAPVSVRIPAGTRSGKTFRVRGHGVPASSGAGDLLVTVEVQVPEALDDAQRAAVEQLATAFPESPRSHLGV
jgi:molecular chaperone DnaJ